MAAYSMDLRTRVLEDCDAGMRADAVAEKYRVSLSWVNRLKQRRRASGEIAPRRHIRWRTPILTPVLPRLEALIAEQSDRTLAELQHALGTSASLTTIWRAIEGLTITIKKRYARPNRIAPTWPPPERWRRVTATIDSGRFAFLDETGAATDLIRLSVLT